MKQYLMIQNPGIAMEEAFYLQGASTKRGGDNSAVIGKFGTGNKHGVAVLLRAELPPTVFAGNLRMEFGVKPLQANDGLRDHTFNPIIVKFGGKDRNGVSRSGIKETTMTVEHGSDDWLSVDLALREFVSNSIDRAVEQAEVEFIAIYLKGKSAEFQQEAVKRGTDASNEVREAVLNYRKTATDYKNVVVEIVGENQVRAKAGVTRVFVPLDDDGQVQKFYDNLGKWFLHFSEPHLLTATILPKSDRNFDGRQTAVIYRRGVRVREFLASDTPSLYDYNLENLKLDESRKVDDWYVQYEAAKAFAAADAVTIARLWQSFLENGKYWEHTFQSYGLENGVQDEAQKVVWNKAFELVAGEGAVISTPEGGELAARKGYKVVHAPEVFVQAAEKRGLPTPAKVLSEDQRLGREVMDPTPDAEAAVDFAWALVEKYKVANGRKRPLVKTFRKVMDGGSQTLGYYKDGTVHINQDIAGQGSFTLGWHALTQQLLVTALEEVAHHVTGATDNSRDFQDFFLNLIVYMAKEQAGVA